jgi:hypothetical protein
MQVYEAVPSPHERQVLLSSCSPRAELKLHGRIECSSLKKAPSSFRAGSVALDSRGDHQDSAGSLLVPTDPLLRKRKPQHQYIYPGWRRPIPCPWAGA